MKQTADHVKSKPAVYHVQSSLWSSLRSSLRVRHWSIVESKAIPAIIDIITMPFSMKRLLCDFRL